MFEATLTQFIRPNGKQVKIHIYLPMEVEPTYDKMIENGHRLTVEKAKTVRKVIICIEGEDTDLFMVQCGFSEDAKPYVNDILRQYGESEYGKVRSEVLFTVDPEQTQDTGSD
jgi:hypothetical protein